MTPEAHPDLEDRLNARGITLGQWGEDNADLFYTFEENNPDPLCDIRIDDLNAQLDDDGIIGFLSPEQHRAFDRQSTRNEIDRENVQRATLGLPYRPRETIGRAP